MPTLVYIKRDCPFCAAVLHALEAGDARPIVCDVEAEPHVVPELLKLTGGRRIVPVIVEGLDVRVAPDGGTRF